MEFSSFSSSILDAISFRFEVTCIWVTIIQRFFSWSKSFLYSQLSLFCRTDHWDERRKRQDFEVHVKVDDRSICREEMEAVMGKLGIFANPEGEKLQERLCSEEISGLFEEKEPSLEELNEAFLVFDVNRDGFIDAEELQRVLRILGFRQGTGIEDCRKMISCHDENGDGSICFNEFVKFAENCLS